MTQARGGKSNDAEREDFRALDALVLAELEALERAVPRQAPPTEAEEKNRSSEDNVVFKETWEPEVAVSDEPTRSPVVAPLHTDIESPAEGDKESVPELTFDEAEDQTESDLFTLEERTFISRTSEWLRQRENKDMIMSRIWALVTESEAGSFFKADDSAAATTEARPGARSDPARAGEDDEWPQG